ncbi:MAG TPA: DMT family transporter [Acetobacteraceae bacterium]
MIELWIPVTVTAALFQTWRTALQQRLRGLLSVNGAGFVRYLYALPTGLGFVLAGYWLTGTPLPMPDAWFLAYSAAGGLLQIFGTSLLIMAFGFRSFAVGTAYAKTEAVQGAIVAWIVLGEALSPLAMLGIGIGVSGVLVLSLAGRGLKRGELLRATFQPAALCGLGAGLCFAFTAVFIKEANRALPGDNVALKAVFGLLATNLMQTAMQGGWLLLREPGQLAKCLASWRSSAWVGTLSACGSACWFTAFALAPVALVRALGQVEMVFTLIFSRFYLQEKISRVDVLGLLLVVGGVVLVLFGR